MAKKPLKKRKKFTHADSLRADKIPRVRREFVDYDYAKTLDQESLEFLAKFNSEYYGASVSKNDDGTVKKDHLHQDLTQVKDIYDDNNRRNNDVYGVTRSNHLLYDIVSETKDNDGWYITDETLTESAAVANLDAPDESDDVLSFDEYMEVKDNMTIEMQFFYEILYGDKN